MKHVFLSVLLLCLTAFGATASDSRIKAELLEGWQMSDGTRMAALRLTLEPGWKTYWRAPGDAGIPPQFNWRGSRNLKAVSVEWPTPKVFEQNGMRSVGYREQVVLPLRIHPKKAGEPVELRLNIDLGICRDICVPKTLKLVGKLITDSRKPSAAIAGALATLPLSAREAGAGKVRCSLRPGKSGLEITAHIPVPKTGGKEHVIIEPASGDIWVSETDITRKGGMITAVADLASMTGKSIALDRSSLRFTVLGHNHAVDLRGCSAG